MVMGTGCGENGLPNATEKALQQCLVAAHIGQQFFPVEVGVRVLPQRPAVVNTATGYRFLVQAQPIDKTVNRTEHGSGDIIGIDLIAGQHQHRRAFVGFRSCLKQQLVHSRQPVGRRRMGPATGAVDQAVHPRPQDKIRPAGSRHAQMRRPVRHPGFPVRILCCRPGA